MLISYLVIKCLRYNGVKATGKTDNQAAIAHTSSTGCKPTFTDKLILKKDKPPSHWFHFFPANSFNVQT